MFIQCVHHLCQRKDQLRGINISFYLEKYDKLLKLHHHFLWESQLSRGFPYCTVLKLNIMLMKID